MPRELLEPRNRAVRKEWYAHFGLTTFAAQDEARQRAYAAYGLDANGRDPDAPDPRDLFRELMNDSPTLPKRRRNNYLEET